MIELYFLVYRLPRMMTRLARERNRSALAWSLLAIGTWIGTEILVGTLLALLYETAALFLGWPQKLSPALNIIFYLSSLASAIVAVTILRRVLYKKDQPGFVPLPPGPPSFGDDAR